MAFLNSTGPVAELARPRPYSGRETQESRPLRYVEGSAVLSAAQINDVVAIAPMPKNARVVAFHLATGALGALTNAQVGYCDTDGSNFVGFGAAQDSSSAIAGFLAAGPLGSNVGADKVLAIQITGAAATGTVWAGVTFRDDRD